MTGELACQTHAPARPVAFHTFVFLLLIPDTALAGCHADVFQGMIQPTVANSQLLTDFAGLRSQKCFLEESNRLDPWIAGAGYVSAHVETMSGLSRR